MTITRALACLCALLVSLSGCKQADYAKQTATFSDSVDKAVVGLRAMYAGINDADRETYLVERLLNPAAPVGDVEACRRADGSLAAQPTLLVQPRFPESAIAARVHLLTMLGSYGEALSALASGSAPADVGEKLDALRKAYIQSGKDAGGKESDFAAAAGPLSSIAGTLAKLYLQRRRSAELTRIIHEAQPTIDRLVQLLQRDAAIAYLAVLSSTDDDYASWTRYYNRVRETALAGPHRPFAAPDPVGRCRSAALDVPPPIPVPRPAPLPSPILVDPARDAASFAIRTAVLDRVVLARERYLAARAADPVAVVASLRKAHAKLVAFADAPDDIRSLADLQAAIAEFKGDAQTLYDAYGKLRTGGK